MNQKPSKKLLILIVLLCVFSACILLCLFAQRNELTLPIISLIIKTPIVYSFVFIVESVIIFLLLISVKTKDKQKKHTNYRIGLQTIFAFSTNSYVTGFALGTIYKGSLKKICVPGLNCYSCPGAYFACPIGAIQAILNKRSFEFDSEMKLKMSPVYYVPMYALGFVMLFGVLCGRLVCGIMCPFGWVQEVIYKLFGFVRRRIKSVLFRTKADKVLRYSKYGFLVIFVLILPLFAERAFPWFCKLVCPSGMFLGGIPLMLTNRTIFSAAGSFTILKLIILCIIVLWSAVNFRPFCKYICPLGAIYGFFNPISLYRYEVKKEKCIDCGKCKSVCNMGVDILNNANPAECIRCGDCKAACPTGAITSGIKIRKEKREWE